MLKKIKKMLDNICQHVMILLTYIQVLCSKLREGREAYLSFSLFSITFKDWRLNVRVGGLIE